MQEVLDCNLGRAWSERLASWREAVIGVGVAYNSDASDSVVGFLSHRSQRRSKFLGRALSKVMPRFLAYPALAVFTVHFGVWAFDLWVSARSVRAPPRLSVVGGSWTTLATAFGSSVAAFTAAFSSSKLGQQLLLPRGVLLRSAIALAALTLLVFVNPFFAWLFAKCVEAFAASTVHEDHGRLGDHCVPEAGEADIHVCGVPNE